MGFPFGCPLTGAKNKGKVQIVTSESVLLREYTEFVWELRRAFVKVVVSRAVRLRECLFRELALCPDLYQEASSMIMSRFERNNGGVRNLIIIIIIII